jgi:hypothetical protein
MAEVMDAGARHKWAFEECECEISTLETYCSDYCSDADDAAEVEAATNIGGKGSGELQFPRDLGETALPVFMN